MPLPVLQEQAPADVDRLEHGLVATTGPWAGPTGVAGALTCI